MTDEQIIKALKCCTIGHACPKDCPYMGAGLCVDKVRKDALALIKRQKAKIKRLEAKSNDWLIRGIPQEQLDEERKEAIKEGAIELFKAKLKENIYIVYIGDNEPMRVVQEVTIDRIAKELTEGDK